MIKKLIYILCLLPLFTYGQWNFFWSYSQYEGWNVEGGSYNFCTQPDQIDAANYDIDFSSDGKYMFIMEGYTYGNYVRRWPLSPFWDITSTNTLEQSLDLETYDNLLFGMTFKPDGTKMYIVGNQYDKIIQFSLSPSWSLPSPSKDGELYVGDKDYTPMDVAFNDDGTQVYFIGQQYDQVHSYNLSTVWTVSTGTYNNYFYIGSQESNPHSLKFDPTGTVMYVSGLADSVFQYRLTTAWNISTAYYDVSLYTGGQQEAQGISFKNDGVKLYSTGGGYVCQYHLNQDDGVDVDLKVGLISCWEFDETSGTTAYDAHGSNNGAIDGATINQTGKINKAYDFDGSNDRIRVPETDFLFGSSDSWSLSAWVKADVFNTFRNILRLDQGTTGRDLWLIRYLNTNYLQVAFGDASGTLHLSSSSNTISDTNWHHVVGVVTPDSVKIYIDNVNVANDSNVSTTWSATSGTYLFIGSSYGTTEFWNGIIDQPAVWNKALSKQEISILYNSGNGKSYSQW